jgi:hypothetical protein
MEQELVYKHVAADGRVCDMVASSEGVKDRPMLAGTTLTFRNPANRRRSIGHPGHR